MFGGGKPGGGFGGGFGGFGASSSTAAPGEAAKPAASAFGASFTTPATTSAFGLGAGASKPDPSKPAAPFSFGAGSAASLAANPATPTPAPFGLAAASSGSSLFGAKPAAGPSLFGSTSAAPATSAPAAPATAAFSGFGATTSAPATSTPAPAAFSGFGSLSTSGLAFGGTSTASTTAAPAPATTTAAPANSLFGSTGGATASAGGFKFGAASGASVGSFGASSSSGTESKAAPFGLKTDTPAAANPTAGTGFGSVKLSTAPVVSGTESSDGKMTGMSTPASGTLGLGAAKPLSATLAASASAPAASGSGNTEVAADLANTALRGKTLEEIVQMWTLELTTQTRAFHTQASTVSYWDRALVQQGKRITELYEATMAVEAEQAALDQSLENMEGQQNALQNLLDSYEGRVQDIVRKTTTRPAGSKGVAMTADEERDHVYSSAERLNTQLDELARRLTALVEDVNCISNADSAAGAGDGEGQRGAADPFAQIVQILNSHLTSLEWVDSQTTQLQERVKNAQRVHQEVSVAQASIAGAYNGGTAGAEYLNDDAYSAPGGLGSAVFHDNSRPTIPGSFVSEPLPPVTSSFGTPLATARKPQGASLLGRAGGVNSSTLRTSAPPASPFGSTPLRRGF
ncbi:FG-nucleoporin nsp1 [Coemansia thaxteri]|uniref:FG-nucleoporin nsp1 n=1 Tax=Coemansia thaxteri TaxID=2663907 RepID=A0A9W8BG70_9FUNG|nr:FG-nucleoporin nsp1 [Coemansia thaxteri]KAJ2480873.1 FG-nucleoporin nsp1 [Coemansia sp. RSA 2320]